MYTIITHVIKEEHYDDIESALDAIANECAYNNSNCNDVTITYSPDNGEYYNSVITPPGSDANIDYGNIKVRFPISG
jgi:hypothetical protein